MNSDKLKEYLISKGASLVGFADLSELGADTMKSGVSIALCIPVDVIKSISDGPNLEYHYWYHELNRRLDHLVESGAQFIRDLGYEAIAQTTSYVKEFGNYRTQIPHKTVATLSGLGWIGKSALFVTEKFGSAIRLSSIITDMPLEYGVPVRKSLCPQTCDRCKNACPGEAISGRLWDYKTDRDEFYDPLKCRAKARQLAWERIQKEITLCGKCIEVCPFTQKYISSNLGITAE
jgi:epoxyqueuosine reductase QueG